MISIKIANMSSQYDAELQLLIPWSEKWSSLHVPQDRTPRKPMPALLIREGMQWNQSGGTSSVYWRRLSEYGRPGHSPACTDLLTQLQLVHDLRREGLRCVAKCIQTHENKHGKDFGIPSVLVLVRGIKCVSGTITLSHKGRKCR
jgi:hypothetical protein